jgi:formylglycine-generating enzyme required for sulfatase activity
MRTFKVLLLLGLTLLRSGYAQEQRFFRVVSPVATTITAFSAEEYITWANAATNATFTIQTAQSLRGQSNWVDYVQVPVTTPVTTHRLFDPNPPFGMVLIPAGSFTMGDTFSESPIGDELPTHTVYVSEFYMDKYKVTKVLWDDVYQWATNHCYNFDYQGLGKADNHPVQTIDWYDAVKWCNARSQKEGLVPAYYTSAAQTDATIYRTGQVDLDNTWVKWNSGYRLPTEAEWEKAARGGARGRRFPWSDADTIMHSRANYRAMSGESYDLSYPAGYHPSFKSNGIPYTSPVGYFAPNGYGIYDMPGNVWDWCWDLYANDWYSNLGATQSNPRGPTGTSGDRTKRGSSWDDNAINARCSDRDHCLPSVSVDWIGFRCVRSVSESLGSVLDFTIVALPDTQHYTAEINGGQMEMFTAQTDWIVNNVGAQKIAFVTHEGDVVQYGSQSEWSNAKTAMFALDNHVPWAIAPGNHDGPDPNTTNDPLYTGYKATFPVSHFAGQSWFCPGSPGVGPNDVNTYSVIRGFNAKGGYRDFLMINLEFEATNVFTWAQQVINANPGKPTILTLHDYICSNPPQDTESDPQQDGRTIIGDAVWTNLVNPNQQVFAVLCGHDNWHTNEMVNFTSNDNAGLPVFEMLADYQSRDDGGGGYMRLLQFDEANNQIHVKTYSPYCHEYLTDSSNQFDLNVNFDARFGTSLLDPPAGSERSQVPRGLQSASPLVVGQD